MVEQREIIAPLVEGLMVPGGPATEVLPRTAAMVVAAVVDTVADTAPVVEERSPGGKPPGFVQSFAFHLAHALHFYA